MKTWFEIKASAADKPVEAFIYDEISDWGTSARDFIAALQPYKDREITLRINSPGGSVFQGLAIYNYLRGLNVKTRVDGIAASMASVVALAGKTVTIAKNGFFMVHNPMGVAVGNSEEMRKVEGVLDKLRASLLETYQRETGATAEQVGKWMDDETWFSADEAKTAGFVDEIDEGMAISASADLSKFSKPPKALTEPVDSSAKGMTDTVSAEKTFIESLKAMLGIKPAQPEPTVQPEAKIDPDLVQARADLATAKQTIGTLETDVKALKDEVEKAKAEAATAKAEADKQASLKAAQITAAQGQPPIDAKPTDKPAQTASTGTWTERCLAANSAKAVK